MKFIIQAIWVDEVTKYTKNEYGFGDFITTEYVRMSHTDSSDVGDLEEGVSNGSYKTILFISDADRDNYSHNYEIIIRDDLGNLFAIEFDSSL